MVASAICVSSMLYTVLEKHPLLFSSVSFWKMFIFMQNCLIMLMMKQVFHWQQSWIFIVTGDVILTSCLQVCK